MQTEQQQQFMQSYMAACNPTYTKRGPGSMDQPMTTFFNFLKEIASVNMKIYQKSGYEKHGLLFIAYVLD